MPSKLENLTQKLNFFSKKLVIFTNSLINTFSEATTIQDVVRTGQPTTEHVQTVEPTMTLPDVTTERATTRITTEVEIPVWTGEYTTEKPAHHKPTTEKDNPTTEVDI